MEETVGSTAPGVSRKKRITKNIFIAVLVGLAINALLGLVADSQSIIDAIRLVGLREIFIPFAAGLLAYLIDTGRFMYMFRQFKVRLSFRDSLYSNLIGFFFSSITPSTAGGQPFQVYHFTRLGLDSTVATNIVFSRLVISNLAQISIILALAAVGGGFSLFDTAGIGGFVLAFGLAVTLFFFLLMTLVLLRPSLVGRLALRLDRSRLGRFIGRISKNERWAETISAWSLDLGDGFKHLWMNRTHFVLVDLCLHILDQAIWAFGLYQPFRALTGAQVPFLPFLFAFNLCGLVSAFVPTPGASGSIEASYALVLGNLAGSSGSALPAIVIWRFGSYYAHLLLTGLVYAFAPVAKDAYETWPDGTVRRRHRTHVKRSS